MLIAKFFFIFVFMSPSCYLFSMNLDQLPCDIIGSTIVQLVNNVGTLEICNGEDIPVIVRYAKALALTNKNLCEKVNSISASKMFVKALSDRFNCGLPAAVEKIRTPGVYRLVEEQLKKNNEYSLFKSLQRVFEIAQEVCEEFQPFICVNNENFRWFSSYDSFMSVWPKRIEKQGLFIWADSIPKLVYTPWGDFRLFDSRYEKWLGFEAFYQAFLKRFNAVFVGITYSSIEDNFSQYRELKQGDSQSIIDLKALFISNTDVSYEAIFKDLSKDEVKEQIGKEKIVFSSCGSMYELCAIDGCKVPKTEACYSQDNFSGRDNKLFIVSILQKLYCQEKGVPALGKIESYDKKCAYKQKTKGFITSVENASEESVKLLMKLEAKPIFKQNNQMVRVLPLEYSNDSSIVKGFYWKAMRKLGYTYKVKNILEGGPYSVLYDYFDNEIDSCLYELLIDNDQKHKCSFDRLKIVFDECLIDLMSGWKKASLVDFAKDLLTKKSEEEWYFFIKPNNDHADGRFLKCLAEVVGVGKSVECHGTASSRRYYSCLWIEKKSYNKVVAALGLKIDG